MCAVLVIVVSGRRAYGDRMSRASAKNRRSYLNIAAVSDTERLTNMYTTGVVLELRSESQTTTTVEIYAHFRKCMPAVEGISVGVLNNNNLLKLHTFLLIFDATVHSYYDRVTVVSAALQSAP